MKLVKDETFVEYVTLNNETRTCDNLKIDSEHVFEKIGQSGSH